ncbi:MAG: hypothetical protein Q7T20_07795 [Saprospiraceae bacterium]|nr:hypothetical protein [Saprospiraceae bacterium]
MNLDKTNAKRAELFSSLYEIEDSISVRDFVRRTYRGSKNGNCRFCEGFRGEATFRNLPHVIPQMLGNKYLVSHFECDNCNAIFSEYEDSLSKYLGIYNTISNTRSASKIPKFKQNKNEEGLKVFVDDKGVVHFISPNLEDIHVNQ